MNWQANYVALSLIKTLHAAYILWEKPFETWTHEDHKLDSELRSIMKSST